MLVSSPLQHSHTNGKVQQVQHNSCWN